MKIKHPKTNRYTRTPEERFWQKVNKGSDNDCWEWTASVDFHGYGILQVAGKKLGAHRFSYSLHYGPLSKGEHVLHSCDNPKCVNPKHIRKGTHAENMSDMKQRSDLSKFTKLDDDKRKQIIESKSSARLLSKNFGVCINTIYLIKRKHNKALKTDQP